MKTHVYLITCLILFKGCSLVTGYGLGARFVEFWKYVFNKDEELDRQKRITLDEEVDGQQQVPLDTHQQYKLEKSISPHEERFTRAEKPKQPSSAVDWISEKLIDNTVNGEGSINKENIISERSEIDNSKVLGDATHTIRTLSTNQVPSDESSGEDDNTFSDGKTSSGEASSGSVAMENGPETISYREVSWPRGTYGLPKPVSGCPDLNDLHWKTGYRFHDTEDDGTENQHSDILHLAGNFTDDGIRHDFCIKDNPEGDANWPEGKYCIYKRGPACPKDLKEGFVIWDDENTDNQNAKGGALPDGQYTEDTKIYFCCYTTGDTDVKIYLPNTKPFYLFAYQSIKCQRVNGMKVTSEFVKFDDEDRGNIDYEGGDYPYGVHKAQKDHMLFLCYYEPYPEVLKAVSSRKAAPRESTNLLQKSQEDLARERIQKEADEEQKSLEKSEEMMRAFLKDAGGEDDETNKSERTRTIIKTIRVPGKSKSYATAIIIGLVLSGVVVSTAIILIAKYVVSRTTVRQVKAEQMENTWRQKTGEQDDIENAKSEDEMSITETDFDDLEEEEEELVEDQLLPDSELKSGLELMFLKQQRHYWRQKPGEKYQ